MRRRTRTTLLVGQVLGSLGIGAAPSVGVLLAASVAHSETWAGVARAGTTVGAALLALPLAALAARHGRGRALALGWWLAAAGAGLLVLAAVRGSVPLLVLGMLGMGGGAAAQLQARFAATDLAEPAHRARSLALVVWVGTFGAVLGPNLGAPGQALAARTRPAGAVRRVRPGRGAARAHRRGGPHRAAAGPAAPRPAPYRRRARSRRPPPVRRARRGAAAGPRRPDGPVRPARARPRARLDGLGDDHDAGAPQPPGRHRQRHRPGHQPARARHVRPGPGGRRRGGPVRPGAGHRRRPGRPRRRPPSSARWARARRRRWRSR